MTSIGQWVLRIRCHACNFAGPIRPIKGIRDTTEQCLKITRESLERASIRILARRHEKAKNSITKIIHQVTAQLPDSIWIAEKFRPLWSGILVFDGKIIKAYDKLSKEIVHIHFSNHEYKWLHKKSWLCGIDYGTGDLPHYELAESENKIDLVMYFKALKSMNYPLKAVICDGNPYIPETARFVYGKHIVHQLCTAHFIRGLKRLLPTEEDKEEERIELSKLIVCIQKVIEADTLEESGERLIELRKIYRECSSILKQPTIMSFKKHKQQLTAHLLYPELNLPHTSNDIENLFKQLMLRLKSLGRFQSQRYARNYLNAWALWRRFTPFTDCKKGRRYRNKKAPLELAGCEIKNADFLKLVK